MSAAIILALVTLQRLSELVIARRNTKALLAQGAYEASPDHYPLIVAVHTLWLGTLWWLAPGRPVDWPLIGLFLLLQAGRLWVLATLGRRWTTRIIVVPGEKLVRSGPFRFVRHPNYWIVVGEIALLPLAFGLWEAALVFSLLNAAVLAVRIRAEERALASAQASS
ncbi:MAG TPA: isoprenylcysteine carboxylmethyltransferase family protein [Allosphingosinicella sp.]|uniref:isoprenylcysteine carboxyl methyltransferase family protein n=1 Tax=Allosphingosinicella sp. TaxID=2823234 RepID=UPI002ED9C491